MVKFSIVIFNNSYFKIKYIQILDTLNTITFYISNPLELLLSILGHNLSLIIDQLRDITEMKAINVTEIYKTMYVFII